MPERLVYHLFYCEVTSQVTRNASISWASDCSLSKERAATINRAPLGARSLAVALPMLELAPVTRIDLSTNFQGDIAQCSSGQSRYRGCVCRWVDSSVAHTKNVARLPSVSPSWNKIEQRSVDT